VHLFAEKKRLLLLLFKENEDSQWQSLHILRLQEFGDNPLW